MSNAAVIMNTVLRLKSAPLREGVSDYVAAPCAHGWSKAARYQWEG